MRSYYSPQNQSYYSKKKPSSAGMKIVGILFAIVIIAGGIRYLKNLGKTIETTENKPVISSFFNDWFIGKEVNLYGALSGKHSEGLLTYENVLVTTGNDIVPIMSSTLDLSTYSGNIYTKGIVAKFDGKKFLVDLKAIGSTAGELQTLILSTEAGAKLFPHIGLKIDTTNNPSIVYSANGNKITFSVAEISGDLQINGFLCEDGFPGKDCKVLAKTYTDGNFVGKDGLTFYKSGSNWFAYNPSGEGYMITTSSDALLYKISSVLYPINDTYIKRLVPSILRLCNLPSSTNTTTIKESLTSWIVKAESCTARVTIEESGEKITTVEGYSTMSGSTNTQSKPATTPPTTPTKTGEAKPTTVAPNTSNAPTPAESGLVFTSTRGAYSIAFPSKGVSYAGTNIEEDLGIKGLFCYVRIDVKSYKDKDNESIGPAVSLYECTSKESGASLASQLPTMKYLTSADGTKLFFIQTNNPNWTTFANGIRIQ